MGMLKLIEWKDESQNTIVYRYDLKKDYITRGSKLTVRESQACVFCDKGRMADVFLPGYYTLDTDNVPLLTRLMSWKYGFESPFKSDVYFVNTKQFPNQRWGTKNPIIIKDSDFGMVRVKAFGTFSFRVSDPYFFLKEISGTIKSFRTEDVVEWLRSSVVTRVSDIMGESGLPIAYMAANLVEMGDEVAKKLTAAFEPSGIEICMFNFENFSLPESVEKALDESTSLGILGKNMDVYERKAQADALRDAARNTGTIGGMMGAGIGLGAGMRMMDAFRAPTGGGATTFACLSCGKNIPTTSKFCPECGAAVRTVCPTCGKNVAPGTRFCPDCGTKLV